MQLPSTDGSDCDIRSVERLSPVVFTVGFVNSFRVLHYPIPNNVFYEVHFHELSLI